MKKSSMEFYACPKCLQALELNEQAADGVEIVKGTLYCPVCRLQFQVDEGVAFFGISDDHAAERISEIRGENEWMITANEVKTHVDFAADSARAGEEIIKRIEEKTGKERDKRRLRVLDVGAGLGCLQSWQFSQHGFQAFAIDLCPEFMVSSDDVARDACIERAVSDCVVLPFKDSSFDVVFCKELVHHVSTPYQLLAELWRVTAEGGLIIIREPCQSVLRSKKRMAELDLATHVGLTHQFYNYFDYVKFIKTVSSHYEISGEAHPIDPHNHPVLNTIQKPIIAAGNMPLIRGIVTTLHLIFIGGSVHIIAARGPLRTIGRPGRSVIPIGVKDVNVEQVRFYRERLVPQIYEMFFTEHFGPGTRADKGSPKPTISISQEKSV